MIDNIECKVKYNKYKNIVTAEGYITYTVNGIEEEQYSKIARFTYDLAMQDALRMKEELEEGIR